VVCGLWSSVYKFVERTTVILGWCCMWVGVLFFYWWVYFVADGMC